MNMKLLEMIVDNEFDGFDEGIKTAKNDLEKVLKATYSLGRYYAIIDIVKLNHAEIAYKIEKKNKKREDKILKVLDILKD